MKPHRLLIAVKSCRRDANAGHHQAIRETWGKETPLGVDLRFFTGLEGVPSVRDEIQLDVPDGYDDLPLKTKAICSWAVQKTFTHIFLCDNDTFLKPRLLVESSGYEKYDYSGFFHIDGVMDFNSTFDYTDERGNHYEKAYPWASGGVGYFLSAKACLCISRTPMTGEWAEDFWVGQEIGGGAGFSIGALDIKDVSSWHLKKTKKYRTYTGDYMREVYKAGSPDLYVEKP